MMPTNSGIASTPPEVIKNNISPLCTRYKVPRHGDCAGFQGQAAAALKQASQLRACMETTDSRKRPHHHDMTLPFLTDMPCIFICAGAVLLRCLCDVRVEVAALCVEVAHL